MNALKRVGVALLLAGTVVLVIAGAATAGATSAHAVKGIGTVNCALSGKVKFSPPLSSTPATTAVKVKVTLGGCTGSNAGRTVTGGHITGTLTGPQGGSCASAPSCRAAR